MTPGTLVSVAPDPDDVPPDRWRVIESIYCRAIVLVDLVGDRASVRTIGEPARIHEVPSRYLRPLRTELFPEKGQGTRAVVYLDQCIVSELVKHGRGELKGKNAAAADVLMRALDRAVFVDETAILLESTGHQVESSGLARGGRAGGLQRHHAAREFLALRARGLRPRSRDEQVRFQIHQLAALRSGGVVYRPSHLWKLGLSRNPNETNAETGEFGGAAVMAVAWGVSQAPIATAQRLEAERAAGEFGSFDKERRDVIEMLREESRFRFTGMLRREPDPVVEPDAIRAVLDGEDLEEVPFVDVKSTLVGSLLAERHRRFRDSDLIDLDVVAAALPFCHFMMLDSNVHDRVLKHGVDERYKTFVVSAKLTDYEKAAEWLESRRAGD